MAKRYKSMGVLRFIGLAVILGIVVGMAPGRASAAQERGGSYSSRTYGFTISWDDAIWQGQGRTDSDGVELSSDLSYGIIQAVEYDGDVNDCVGDSVTGLSGRDNVTEFGKAPRRMERPASARDAEGELFTYVDTDNNDAEVAMYVECRALEVDGALLQVVLLSFEQDYADAVTTWERVLGDIETGSSKSSSSKGDKPSKNDSGKKGNSTQAAGLDGNRYYAPEVGFSSTWDEDIWSARELTADEEMGTGIEVTTEMTIGWITAGDPLKGDFEDCATTYAEGIAQYEAISRFRPASSKYDLPATDKSAVGALYTFVQTTDADSGDSVKMIGYFECRPLADDQSVAMIFLATAQEAYVDELPAWEDLLSGIEIDDPATSKSDKSSSKNDEPTKSDKPAATKDASFVGPNFGFTVALDESLWKIEDLSSETTDFLSLDSEFAIGSIVAFGGTYDAESCLQTLVDLKTGDGVTGFEVAPSSFERPKTARKAAGELFIYTVEGDNGPIEIMSYFECRALAGGDASLGVVLSTVPDVYEQAIPEFEAILAGIGTAQQA